MKYDCIHFCWSVFIDNYMYKLKAEKPLFWKLYVAKETGVQVAVLLSSYLYKKQHSKLQFNLETVDKKSLFLESPLINSHQYYYYFIIYV